MVQLKGVATYYFLIPIINSLSKRTLVSLESFVMAVICTSRCPALIQLWGYSINLQFTWKQGRRCECSIARCILMFYVLLLDWLWLLTTALCHVCIAAWLAVAPDFSSVSCMCCCLVSYGSWLQLCHAYVIIIKSSSSLSLPPPLCLLFSGIVYYQSSHKVHSRQ